MGVIWILLLRNIMVFLENMLAVYNKNYHFTSSQTILFLRLILLGLCINKCSISLILPITHSVMHCIIPRMIHYCEALPIPQFYPEKKNLNFIFYPMYFTLFPNDPQPSKLRKLSLFSA